MKAYLLFFFLASVLTAGAAPQTNSPPSLPTALVVLTWSASASAASQPIVYAVWYGTNSGVYFASWSAGGNLALTLTNIPRGVTYYFAVTAASASGTTSAYSNEATNTSPAVPAAPFALTVGPAQ
jgi:hypothetical protein